MEDVFTKKALRLTVLVEFVISAGIGIYFHWVLQWKREAYVVLATGMLLTLATYLILEEISRSRDLVMARYQSSHGLLAALSLIDDPECQERAHGLLAATEHTLSILQSGHIPLDEREFYLEGARCTDRSRRQIKAVDPLTMGWDSRGALRNYYLANLQALERGVLISRIFVIRREELNSADVQKVLKTQFADKIDVRLVFLDEFNTHSGLNSVSLDFAIYDDLVVTERVGLGGNYFGSKTRRPVEVARYQHTFDIIAHSAQRVELVNGQVMPFYLPGTKIEERLYGT